jgi:hypothetical protein
MPETRLRLSPLVLTVFKHETSDGAVLRHCELQRVYTPDDGESFQYTSSLRLHDLRKAAALLNVAANRLNEFAIEHIDTEPQPDDAR